jgi:hypothetical protein
MSAARAWLDPRRLDALPSVLADIAPQRLAAAAHGLIYGNREAALDSQAASSAADPPRSVRVEVRDRSGTLLVSSSVVAAISATVGALPAEAGGFLGFSEGELNRFRFDETSICTGGTYAPDVVSANEQRRWWEREGGVFCGCVHSHPGRMSHPSVEDCRYAQRMLANAKVPELVLPIVTVTRGGGCEMHWYVARPGRGERAEIVPVEVSFVTHALPGQFDRVEAAYDHEWLRRCRVVAVGCGGAREALENFARIGVGQFVLIDPDRVSAQNLATQAVYRHEVGRAKVLACEDAIRQINPDAAVVAIQRPVQEIAPQQLRMLLTGAWEAVGAPRRVVVGTWSDDPAANAFAHQAGWQAGLPVVSASLHRQAASGEVILAYPGRTRGCVRCATKSRYDHYAAGGANDATSAGAPYWATPRLNALKLCVTAAVLHAVAPGERRVSAERRLQSALLDRIVERPMALLRLAPDAGERSGLRVHDHVLAGCARPDRLLFDETVWREVDPVPDCPDCGGQPVARRPVGRRGLISRLGGATWTA